jgi:hypothetical protein
MPEEYLNKQVLIEKDSRQTALDSNRPQNQISHILRSLIKIVAITIGLLVIASLIISYIVESVPKSSIKTSVIYKYKGVSGRVVFPDKSDPVNSYVFSLTSGSKYAEVYHVQTGESYNIAHFDFPWTSQPLNVSSDGNLFWLDTDNDKAILLSLKSGSLKELSFNDENYRSLKTLYFLKDNKIFYEDKKKIFDFSAMEIIEPTMKTVDQMYNNVLVIKPSVLTGGAYRESVSVFCDENYVFGDPNNFFDTKEGTRYVFDLMENLNCIISHSESVYYIDGPSEYLVILGIDDIKFGRNVIFRVGYDERFLEFENIDKIVIKDESLYRTHTMIDLRGKVASKKISFEIDIRCKETDFEGGCIGGEYMSFDLYKDLQKIGTINRESIKFAGVSKDYMYLYIATDKGIERINI